jgi:RNA polymerase sigma-70 factor, ECF subfamily
LFVERVMFDGGFGVTAQADARALTQRRADFSALYEQHAVEVYRYVHRRCRDRALAEDVTQDAFLAAVRSVDDPATITAGWLIQVARNRLLDVLRRQARYEGKLRLVGGREVVADEPAVVVGRLRMTAALEELRVEHRVVLMLHYVDGLTVTALADELGRTPKAVEALLTRARRALRSELEGSDA